MSSILPATDVMQMIQYKQPKQWYDIGWKDDRCQKQILWGAGWMKSGETDTQQKWNAHLNVARRNKCLSQATYDNKEMFTRWKIRMFMLNCYLWILDWCRLSLTCSLFQPNLGQLGVLGDTIGRRHITARVVVTILVCVYTPITVRVAAKVSDAALKRAE